MAGQPRTLFFTPTVSGTYLVGVDSSFSLDQGPFTLTVLEQSYRPESRCATAPLLPPLPNPAATTKSTITGNLSAGSSYLSPPTPTTPFDITDPAHYNYKKEIMVVDSLGKTHSVGLYFRNDEITGWNWRAMTGTQKQAGMGMLTGGALTMGGVASLQFTSATGNSFGDAADQTVALTLTAVTNSAAVSSIVQSSRDGALGMRTYQIVDTAGGTHGPAAFTCGGSQALAGPRVFYDMAMTQGRKYQLALYQKQDLKPYVAVTSTGCQPAAIQTSCSSNGITGAVFGPVPKKYLKVYAFTAPKTTTYTIGVGSAVKTTFGALILSVKDITSP